MQLLNELIHDSITKKGVFGATLFSMTEVIVDNIGPFIGVLSGLLGLYLVVISIIQKHREMSRWFTNNKHKKL